MIKNLSTRFVPIPKHALDFNSMRQTSQAVNALRNMQIVQGSKSVGRVYGTDSNTVLELPAQPSTDMIFPFKIYQIKNASATADQIAQFTTLGEDINSYTFQIRNGLVTGRPYINAPGDNPAGGYYDTYPVIGNYESLTPCPNTDSAPGTYDFASTETEEFYYPQVANTGTSIILDSLNPTLICGIPAGSPAYTNYLINNQIVLNPVSDGFDQFTSWSAGFWIELIDDPLNGFYANLMGQMYSGDDYFGRTANPFPTNDPNCIPIGIVEIGYTSQTSYSGPVAAYVENYLTGNFVSRFNQNQANLRGGWNEIFAALPAGKTKLYFYPGDIVINDANTITINTDSATDSMTFHGVYQCTAFNGAGLVVANDPVTSPAGWLLIGLTQ